jgi:hypothetical protein
MNYHNVIRIKANLDRSPLALESHKGLVIHDIPPVEITELEMQRKENGATLVHANAMRTFLSTDWKYVVVLEDDAILNEDKEWLSYEMFDFFVPFAHNRLHLDSNKRIREKKLPKYGAFAYLCSRDFATRYLHLLEIGGLADVVSHKAASGLRYGSYAGNLVNHDNDAPSMISEDRRKAYLKKNAASNNQPTFIDRVRLKLGM